MNFYLHDTATPWSWRHLKLPNSALHAVWGRSSSEVWACGADGLVIHWDGYRWRQLSAPTREFLWAIWARNTEDVWFAGTNGILLRWDGRTWWAPESRPWSGEDDLRAVTGDERSLWVLCKQRSRLDPYLYHFDGERWTDWNEGVEESLRHVIGAAQNCVWATSYGDLALVRVKRVTKYASLHAVYHPNDRLRSSRRDQLMAAFFDGQSADLLGSFGLRVRLREGFGRPSECLDRGTDVPSDLLHEKQRKNPKEFKDGYLPGNGEAWMVRDGVHYHDGEVYEPHEQTGWRQVHRSEKPLNAIWGHHRNDIWAVGDQGVVVHWDGREWRPHNPGPRLFLSSGIRIDDSRMALFGYVMNSDPVSALEFQDGQWPIVGRGPSWLGRLDDSWTRLAACASPEPSGTRSTDVWTDVWIDNREQVGHFDGRAWRVWTDVQPTFSDPHIWTSGPDDAWRTVGLGRLEHWDGRMWTKVAFQPSEQPTALWGASPDDVWLGTDRGSLLRLRDGVWERVTLDDKLVRHCQGIGCIHGSAADDVWASVGVGMVLHWDGETWSQPGALPNRSRFESGSVTALLVRAPNDVWAAGFYSQLWHWNGRQWRLDDQPSASSIQVLLGSSAGDIWAAGRDGLLVHRPPPSIPAPVHGDADSVARFLAAATERMSAARVHIDFEPIERVAPWHTVAVGARLMLDRLRGFLPDSTVPTRLEQLGEDWLIREDTRCAYLALLHVLVYGVAGEPARMATSEVADIVDALMAGMAEPMAAFCGGISWKRDALRENTLVQRVRLALDSSNKPPVGFLFISCDYLFAITVA